MLRIGNARIILLGMLIILLSGCAPPASPRLVMDAGIAPDLAALADETWALFLTAFAGRRACFGDVTLRTGELVQGRAAYDPQSATVTVATPATAALLQAALVHEWAHHVEHQCPAHAELRPAFLAAQGLSEDADWFHGAHWAAIPSEQYAEAAVIVVLGRRRLPTKAAVTPAAVAVLAAWALDE